jgi:hypothetical protein
LLKTPDKQREFNNRVKNEDALYKHLAMQATIDEKARRIIEDRNETKYEKARVTYENLSFERYYLKQLLNDAKHPARPLEMDHVKPEKVLRPKDTPAPTYQTYEQKAEDFYADFELYQENKKAQIDRIELFYILEQFYERTRNTPDADSEAQAHMREYFSNPENTFFYDKNKIV